MASRNQRRERPRESETEACREEFESKRLAKSRQMESEWKRIVEATRGDLLTELTECFLSTFDPNYFHAMSSLTAFGLEGTTDVRVRKLKTLRHRLMNRVAIDAVGEELRQQTVSGRKPSLRKALDVATANYGYNETSFEAAKKCIEKAYRDYEKGHFPDGDTGAKLLVIDCSPGQELEAARSGIPYVVNDNAGARFAVFKGERIVLRRFYGRDATLAQASQPTGYVPAIGDDRLNVVGKAACSEDTKTST